MRICEPSEREGAAELSPQEIIKRLVAAGENWAGERVSDDDMTFVILKAVSPENLAEMENN